MCDLSVTPSVQPSEEVLSWEVEYRPASNADEALNCTSSRIVDHLGLSHVTNALSYLTARTVSIQGTLRIHFTDRDTDVEKNRNKAVLAQVAISRTGEIDAKIIGLINAGKSAEAIQETEEEIVRARPLLFLSVLADI